MVKKCRKFSINKYSFLAVSNKEMRIREDIHNVYIAMWGQYEHKLLYAMPSMIEKDDVIIFREYIYPIYIEYKDNYPVYIEYEYTILDIQENFLGILALWVTTDEFKRELPCVLYLTK